jgi:hypothetical protein
MKSFSLTISTNVLFGSGRIEEVGAELQKLSERKVLWVYGGKSLKESGLHTAIERQLHDKHIVFEEYGGVQANPTISHVRQGIVLARQELIDVVLAVGGGSVIDAAKAIAVGVAC